MSQNSHSIPLSDAVTMTHAYQNDPQFQGLTVACKIDAAAYDDVLKQPGCEGIRTYFAKNASNELTIVVVGVDAAGNDMTTGIILNRAGSCPANCSSSSPLI